MRDGIWMSDYAVSTVDTVVEAGALQSKMSAQKTELIALTRALELRERFQVCLWSITRTWGNLERKGIVVISR